MLRFLERSVNLLTQQFQKIKFNDKTLQKIWILKLWNLCLKFLLFFSLNIFWLNWSKHFFPFLIILCRKKSNIFKCPGELLLPLYKYDWNSSCRLDQNSWFWFLKFGFGPCYMSSFQYKDWYFVYIYIFKMSRSG